MKSYYVLFTIKNKAICGVWKRANSKEDACMFAEFALMAKYPNVEFDKTEVIKTEE